jgi:hypothetical protein
MPLDPTDVANDIATIKTGIENEFTNFFATAESGGERYEVAVGIGEDEVTLIYTERTPPKPTFSVQVPSGEPAIGAHIKGAPGTTATVFKLDSAPEVTGYKIYVSI